MGSNRITPKNIQLEFQTISAEIRDFGQFRPKFENSVGFQNLVQNLDFIFISIFLFHLFFFLLSIFISSYSLPFF